MIIIYLQGRLGNQMFQYAAAKYLKKIYKDDIYFDWSDVYNCHSAENDGWEDSLKYFNTNYKNIETYNVFALKTLKKLNYYFDRVNYRIYKWFKIRIPKLKFIYYIENLMGIHIYESGYIDIKYNKNKNINYYQGYFESSKYFDEIKEDIMNDFTPRFPPKKENLTLYNIINNTESICVSIRRGDFFSDKNANIYGICNNNYYINAVNEIRKRYKNAVVIAFSDDIDWVKENIDFGCETYYETGKDELWEKLRLMYSCKHFVISNSTFSWWAQYLSRNKNKMVIAPSIWRKDGRKCDIYEDSWIKMEI